jgi:hypothetical protein
VYYGIYFHLRSGPEGAGAEAAAGVGAGGILVLLFLFFGVEKVGETVHVFLGTGG